jgi:hypothetical protein
VVSIPDRGVEIGEIGFILDKDLSRFPQPLDDLVTCYHSVVLSERLGGKIKTGMREGKWNPAPILISIEDLPLPLKQIGFAG